MGLDLLTFMEGTARVIFVDSLSGFGSTGQPVVLDGIRAGENESVSYGHSGGLNYLLRALPNVWEGDLPEILLVGAEGFADEPTIAGIAKTCVKMAVEDSTLKSPTKIEF